MYIYIRVQYNVSRVCTNKTLVSRVPIPLPTTRRGGAGGGRPTRLCAFRILFNVNPTRPNRWVTRFSRSASTWRARAPGTPYVRRQTSR